MPQTTKGKETAGPCPSRIASSLAPATQPQSSTSEVTIAYAPVAIMSTTAHDQMYHDPDKVLYDGDTPAEEYDEAGAIHIVSG